MTDSTRLRTAKSYLNTLRTLDTNALNALVALISDKSFTQTICPASVSPGPFDKQAYIARICSLRAVLTGFPVTILDIIESEASNSVWVHCTAVPEWKDEVKGSPAGEEVDWHYQGEYVFMLWMDESGEKVVRCKEMVDSQGMSKMGGLFAKSMAIVAEK